LSELSSPRASVLGGNYADIFLMLLPNSKDDPCPPPSLCGKYQDADLFPRKVDVMSTRSYWLDLFTGTTWKEFLDAGGMVSGFRDSRWKTVQKMKPGDYLLCYLTGISRFIGILEVTSPAFRDQSPIWKDEDFPSRVRVKEVVSLTAETAVPVYELRDRLSFFKDVKSPIAWTGHFRGSADSMLG